MAVKAFDLIAGHPVLDFVNTLDNRFGVNEPDELLQSYGELVRFMEQSQLLSAGHGRKLARKSTEKGGQRALQSAVELREALSEVLYQVIDGRSLRAGTLRLLEKYFHQANARRTLARVDKAFVWSWKGVQNESDFPVWLLALAASDLLVSDAISRVRSCDSPTCRWLFLDTSKNRKRRWCSMELCGNRMKAKRFHARREESNSAR